MTANRGRRFVSGLCVAGGLALAWPSPVLAGQDAPQDQGSAQATDDQPSLAAFLAATRISVDLDGYYAWNTNRPQDRVNLLRAYDVSANSFSLNQAGLVVDASPDPSKGRRAGLRVDLMYGQATETLQGSAANEPRPQVYRPLFQAYGSYVFPLGTGLQVDFGKFSSALGYENNYTKDQFNYSRSYFFDFLPFYHMGARASYSPTDRVNVTYWLVNGAQQTEDFNGFKSQAAIVTLKPAARVTWNVNYYNGREGRDLSPGVPDPARTHIVDSYVNWTVVPRLTLAGEADYVTVRRPAAPSSIVKGGAAYVQYKVRPNVHLAARAEYFDDGGGLFTGRAQHLHETTATVSWLPSPGFLVRAEWRRDNSTEPFFPSPSAQALGRSMQTFTLGLVWWIGNAL